MNKFLLLNLVTQLTSTADDYNDQEDQDWIALNGKNLFYNIQAGHLQLGPIKLNFEEN